MLSHISDALIDHQKWLMTGEGGRAVLVENDFRGYDFSHKDLRRAIFNGSEFQGASFEHADLRESDFDGADLRGADFEGADLTEANFCGADLSGANFRYADLTRTYFNHARLYRANLHKSKIEHVFEGADYDNWSCHALIAEALRRALPMGQSDPKKIQKRQLVALIEECRDLCWDDFLFMRHPAEEWALRTLARYIVNGLGAPPAVMKCVPWSEHYQPSVKPVAGTANCIL